MNYEQLKTNIQNIIENTFSDDELDMFIQQAEQKIYQSVFLPAMRRNQTGTVTTGNPYLSVPTGFLNVYSLAVTTGGTTYLLPKDVSFIREAFPYPAVTGRPQYYGNFDADTFIVGPTPDADYVMELHFEGYPESIVTAGNTWLGDNFDNVLLNGAVLEGLRFIKAEPAQIENTEKFYLQGIGLITNYTDKKLTGDQYRGYRR